MQRLVRIVEAALLAALMAGVPASAALHAQATRAPYAPPKTRDGQPDISGFWQVVNTAAWDIQDHGASLGVPAGKGVVEGDEIPYKPEMLAKRKQNFDALQSVTPENLAASDKLEWLYFIKNGLVYKVTSYADVRKLIE